MRMRAGFIVPAGAGKVVKGVLGEVAPGEQIQDKFLQGSLSMRSRPLRMSTLVWILLISVLGFIRCLTHGGDSNLVLRVWIGSCDKLLLHLGKIE